MYRALTLSLALSAAALPALAQTAPAMDPAVVEEQVASSADAGIIVPLLALLVLLAAISGSSGAALTPPT